MTTYLLTTGDDTLNGTAGADTFDETLNGKSGGVDNLSGGEGNDTFQLLDGDQDFVDGGSGVDTLNISDRLFNLKTKNVEILNFVDPNPRALTSVEEISKFKTISASGESNLTIDFYFIGVGGTLNILSRIEAGTKIDLDAAELSSGLDFTGGDSGNKILGTRFNDVLHGGSGADILLGNLGSEELYGHEGDDIFGIEDSDEETQYVDGGEGYDSLHVFHHRNIDSFLVKNVENLSIGLGTIASISTLQKFETISGRPGTFIDIDLVGVGGLIEFS